MKPGKNPSVETHKYSPYITPAVYYNTLHHATIRGTGMISKHAVGNTIFFIITVLFITGCGATTETIRETLPDHGIEPVPAGRFDTGRMWTFDFPPVEYFNETYRFTATDEWFTHARLAALRLPNCTASFVSAGGLAMTNHHCVLGALESVAREDENLLDDGFYAATLGEERRVEGLYVDQLVLIDDVTDEVIAAFERGETDDDRIVQREQKIREIEERCGEGEGLICSVVTFFNGGRYALYGYKRFDDVRLVYTPEASVGFFGGDPDNFTYPRYNLDVAFLRIYGDDDTPLVPEYYFEWSRTGSREGDAVFVIGNPGRTNRLHTVDQLLFNRDEAYPFLLGMLDAMVEIHREHIERYPDMRSRYETRLFSFENSQKAYRGLIRGLHEANLMGRKVDFENRFKAEVSDREYLAQEYGGVWDEIARLQHEKRGIFTELQAVNFRGIGKSTFFGLAADLVDLARQMRLTEDYQSQDEIQEFIDAALGDIYPEEEIDVPLEKEILAYQLFYMRSNLEGDDPALRGLLTNRSPADAATALVERTVLTNRESVRSLLEQGPEAVLGSSDPFIRHVILVADRASTLRGRYAEIQSRESAHVQRLGRALYEIYGTSIPPDATFTLRIADGVVKTYEYNGTIAPPYTTFYGLYDRYHSHGRTHPWSLPDQWRTPPGEFRMSTPVNFVSTNDIIGGNSGSPVINSDLEIVGLVFDGNIESLPGNFIFAEEYNRAVSVHSEGILEALRYMYGAHRIIYELETGTLR
jgi:hypothetical protein